MSDNDKFYRAFEDKLRGSREVIIERLQVYSPYLEGLKTRIDQPAALDIGCGRGEWLELLGDAGFQATGVDLDQGMLTEGRESGLAVEQGDGIARLTGMEDNSLALVSAFHVVEHIGFDQLRVLVREALRVLKPGGLLIMETPNPDNLSVGANSFYLDPTHDKPLPPDLLSFLPEFYGYHRSVVLRLQEPEGLSTNPHPTLSNVLLNASPDYAVIAQKSASQQELSTLDHAFSQALELGVSLQQLAGRFDAALNNRFEEQHQFHSQAFEAEWRERMAQQESLQRQLDSGQEQARAMQEQTQAMITELHGVYQSRSWRITRPLRDLNGQLSALREQGPVNRLKAGLRPPVLGLVRFADRKTRQRPALRNRIVMLLKKLGILSRTGTFYHNARMHQAAQAWQDEGYELTDSQKAAQIAWTPRPDDLSNEEILKRIRREVQLANQQRGSE